MAQWEIKKVSASDLNNGNEFVDEDGIRTIDINNVFRSTLFTQDVIEKLATTSQTLSPNQSAIATIIRDTNGYITINFGIPQGVQGSQGLQGTSVRYNSNYDSTKTYYNNSSYIDIVQINGSSYIPLNSSVVGIQPPNTSYWGVLANKGENGEGVGNIYINPSSVEDDSSKNYMLKLVSKDDSSITFELVDSQENTIVDVECSHEVEITSQGENDCNLVIEDQSIVINKIQGQTKRLSDNYIRTTDRTQESNGITCTTLNGVLTLNGTATANATFNPYTSYICKLIPTNVPITLYAEILSGTISGGTFEINFIKNYGLSSSFVDYSIQLTKDNIIRNTTLSNVVVAQLFIPSGTTFTNYQIRFQCYEGTYNVENMPTFKPYNSNISNAKANLLSTTPSGVESYIQDKMDIGIELGVGSYIDNINGKVHQKTKNSIITLNGSESWTLGTTYTNVQRFDLSFDGSDGYYTNSSGNAYRGNGASNLTWIHDSGFANIKDLSICFNASLTTLYVLVPLSANITTLADFKNWLTQLYNAGYPIQFTYEINEDTISDISLPLGYQVWKNGYQYQNVVSGYVPYILHKQYGISLKAQVLNNVEIDRQQQKQLDEIKQNSVQTFKEQNYIQGGNATLIELNFEGEGDIYVENNDNGFLLIETLKKLTAKPSQELIISTNTTSLSIDLEVGTYLVYNDDGVVVKFIVFENYMNDGDKEGFGNIIQTTSSGYYATYGNGILVMYYHSVGATTQQTITRVEKLINY